LERAAELLELLFRDKYGFAMRVTPRRSISEMFCLSACLAHPLTIGNGTYAPGESINLNSPARLRQGPELFRSQNRLLFSFLVAAEICGPIVDPIHLIRMKVLLAHLSRAHARARGNRSRISGTVREITIDQLDETIK
jgi:hypothetical protein